MASFDLSPFIDSSADTPYDNQVYYPMPPLDRYGVYHSPTLAFKNQVALNKRDPRWNDAGRGLGLGLSGVRKCCGVLQSTYVLSHQPVFLPDDAPPSGSPVSESTEEVCDPAEAKPLWTTLAEFMDTTYSLLMLPDSPMLETEPSSTTDLAPALLPEIFRGVSLASGHAEIPLSLVDNDVSPTMTLESPIVPSPKNTFLPTTYESIRFPGTLRSPRVWKAVPKRKDGAGTLTSPRQQPRPAKTLSVRFCPNTQIRNPAEQPAWFQREKARAEVQFRRFRIGADRTVWDRRRVHCLRHEEQIPVERTTGSEILGRHRTAAEVEEEAIWEDEEDERREKEARERKPRFVVCGSPYDVALRQQRRRCEGEKARETRMKMWLKLEKECVIAEHIEQLCMD